MTSVSSAPLAWSKPETWHPKLERLYTYWRSIHPPAGLPGRQHIDPTTIPDLLPDVYMVDVIRTPLRFRYRLVGTEFAQRMGHDLTGQYLDEAHPGFADVIKQYVAVVEQREPAYRNGPVLFTAAKKDYQSIERLMVPMARNGIDVDLIFAVIVYLRSGAATAFK